MIINRELANSAGLKEKDFWKTPNGLYEPINNVFNFTLDPCCEIETPKCSKFFTLAADGLKQDWSKDVVFMNPPYSRGNIDKWVEKAYLESLKGSVVVALLPVSASAKWWHNWVIQKSNIVYIQGRVTFIDAESSAPFSSVLAIFNSDRKFRNMEYVGGGIFKLNEL